MTTLINPTAGIYLQNLGACSGGFKTWSRQYDLPKYGCRITGETHTSGRVNFPVFCCPSNVKQQILAAEQRKKKERYDRCVREGGSVKWRRLGSVNLSERGETCYPSGSTRTEQQAAGRGWIDYTMEQVCCKQRTSPIGPPIGPGDPPVIPSIPQQVVQPARRMPWSWIVIGAGAGALLIYLLKK